MAKVSAEISYELSKQIERIVRDGWFPSEEDVVKEALEQLIEEKSFLGDYPSMLHRYAADEHNESKPETALKFVDRAVSLLSSQKMMDLPLYQSLVELRVQILLVMSRKDDAITGLEEAQQKLPNNPSITRWLERLKVKGA